MPYPIVNTLPTAPSRVGNLPDFTTQSILFLDALPSAQSSYNVFLTYIDQAEPNIHCNGSITDVVPALVSSKQLTLPSGAGIPYVSAIDTIYSDIQYITNQDAAYVGAYFDKVLEIKGQVSSYPTKPAISQVNTPPSRAQGKTGFNTSAVSFSATFKNAQSSLQTCLAAVHADCFTAVDNGTVTDGTVSVTTDAGALTDSTITT